MTEELLARIKAAFHGVEDASDNDQWLAQASGGASVPLMKGISSPRSYFVLLTLQVGGFQRITGAEDKSLWQVALKFSGCHFWIRDRNGSTWSVGCDEGGEKGAEACERLVKKIRNAANLVDKDLSQYLTEKAERVGFHIHNPHALLFQTFKHFRDRVEELAKPWTPEKRSAAGDAGDTLTAAWNEGLALSYSAAAMVAFFFSYMELAMDVQLAFQHPRTMTLKEFRKLTWAERCAAVFPMNDPEFKRIYPELRAWKKTVRDECSMASAGRGVSSYPWSTSGSCQSRTRTWTR